MRVDGGAGARCRLNYRLNVACEADINALCTEECSPYLGQACGGRVLRCLTEKQDSITSKQCQARPTSRRWAQGLGCVLRCLNPSHQACLLSTTLLPGSSLPVHCAPVWHQDEFRHVQTKA